MCCAVLSHSVVSDSVTPWTVAHQAPLSMGILQARILEWVATHPSPVDFPVQESNWSLLHCRWILHQLSYQGSPMCYLMVVLICISLMCSLQSAKTRPEADCGSDHELLIAKFSLKLKKVGNTTRPLRYDLNQIPYDYTVEVTNRFK